MDPRNVKPNLFDRRVHLSLQERKWREHPDYVPPPLAPGGEPRREGLVLFLALVICLVAAGAAIWLGLP